jgi:hypothetical protein
LDTARDGVTLEHIDAEALWALDIVDTERYICRGCRQQVFPASYDRAVNLKRPYFRVGAGKRHAPDCKVDGEEVLVGKARRQSVYSGQGFPLPFPSRVVLGEERAVVADPSLGEIPTASGRPSGQGAGRAQSTGHHGHTVTTIKSVCTTFLDAPFDRNILPLRIPGIEGRTYQEVFRHAKTALRADGQVRALFYAPIRWKAEPNCSDVACEVMLNTGVWDDGLRDFSEPMRVRIDWREWTERKRKVFLYSYAVAQQEAREKARSNSGVKGWLFFVGMIDPLDRRLFLVDSFRTICCIADELIMPAVHGKAVRSRQ